MDGVPLARAGLSMGRCPWFIISTPKASYNNLAN